MTKLYRFLLVDDSLLDLFIHKKLIALSDLAESITTLNSAEEALQFLNEQGKMLEESIMLLDLQMPGMNGFEFIDEFSKMPEYIKEKVRIFILSSTVDESDVERSKSNPYVEEMLPKPVNVAQLKMKLMAMNTAN